MFLRGYWGSSRIAGGGWQSGVVRCKNWGHWASIRVLNNKKIKDNFVIMQLNPWFSYRPKEYELSIFIYKI